MKRLFLSIALLITTVFCARAQNDIGNNLFQHMRKDALILSQNGMVRGDEALKGFINDFEAKHGAVKSYKKEFSIEVNAVLDYEIGQITTASEAFKVMFLKRKDDPNAAKIEFLTLYSDENPVAMPDGIDQQRNLWMQHCNAHQADKLVSEVYTPDAYYYNRGRLLQGTKAITAEYGYMNSANYSLKLTPKHVAFVSPNIAYEIGRCSGSYPLPYMLLWEKQANGTWQVLMDSNY